MHQTEKWGVFELAVQGHSDGNPFVDYNITGTFRHERETVSVDGFYDGGGTYRVRFMPSHEGEYTYDITGTFGGPVSGGFTAVPPTENNHGPVRVIHKYHLAYADGTPHRSVGTTSYVFALEKPETVEQTFSELEKSPFNKLRFCIFPKHYDYCLHDPVCFPYEGTPMDASVLTPKNFYEYTGTTEGSDWDFSRFNPEFFQIYDRVVRRLMDMGMEADLILFHPYDRWGFSQMPMEDSKRYLRYMAARYGAFRNVWWSMANEYDLFKIRTVEEFDELGSAMSSLDPYGHLISIHNAGTFYDYTRPWITHCSCQRADLYKTTESTDELRHQYGKPVIWDEVGYEGDLPHCWGNFTAEELIRRAWEAVLRGGYCGHSECYLSDDGVIWWAHGGRMKGESASRFGFLREFLEDAPELRLGEELKDELHFQWDDFAAVPEDPGLMGEYYFFYYSLWRPASRQIWIDDDTWYDVEIIDTWNMTVTPFGRHRGRFDVPLPRKQYMGIRLKRARQ